MVNPNPVGMQGERLARNHLTSLGYTILHSNYATRAGEIDIIAVKEQHLIFVEVKARVSVAQGLPYEAVRYGKLRRMYRAIQMFLYTGNYRDYKHSVWVISIILTSNLALKSLKVYEDVPIT